MMTRNSVSALRPRASTHARFALSLVAAFLLPCLFAAAPAITVPDLPQRLAALDGKTPLLYFLLAEEVAAEIPGHDGRELARHLLVIAHELDRNAPRPSGGLARGIYLALASIAERDGEREWLLALAGVRDNGAQSTAPPAAALLVADALVAARAGEGREVKRILADPNAAPALQYLRRAAPAVADFLNAAQSESSCPVCQNRRMIKSSAPRIGGGAEETYTLCPECRGNPGPRISAEFFARTIAAESILLGAVHQSWSAQTWIDRGAPLRDPNPAELAAYYAVDPAAKIWQAQPDNPDPMQGRWLISSPQK